MLSSLQIENAYLLGAHVAKTSGDTNPQTHFLNPGTPDGDMLVHWFRQGFGDEKMGKVAAALHLG